MRKDLQETIKEAQDKIKSLKEEREYRKGDMHGKHPDDERVPQEIIVQQFNLHYYRCQIELQNKRWEEAKIKNIETLAELKGLDTQLQQELDIAMFKY